MISYILCIFIKIMKFVIFHKNWRNSWFLSISQNWVHFLNFGSKKGCWGTKIPKFRVFCDFCGTGGWGFSGFENFRVPKINRLSCTVFEGPQTPYKIRVLGWPTPHTFFHFLYGVWGPSNTVQTNRNILGTRFFRKIADFHGFSWFSRFWKNAKIIEMHVFH